MSALSAANDVSLKPVSFYKGGEFVTLEKIVCDLNHIQETIDNDCESEMV